MISPTSICNLALGRLGTTRIMTLDEESQPARYCKLFYTQVRDAVLREHAWNFAQARAVLSKLEAAPAFGWANAYQLPADCIRVLRVNEHDFQQAGVEWEVEGEMLLTDAYEAKVIYTRREEDAGLYDPLFVAALVTKMAANLAMPLTGSPDQAAQLRGEYHAIIEDQARREDAAEARPKRARDWVQSDLTQSREGSDWGVSKNVHAGEGVQRFTQLGQVPHPVHVTGSLFGDRFLRSWTIPPFAINGYLKMFGGDEDDVLEVGEYPLLGPVIPHAILHSLDGIAVAHGFRLIWWTSQSFSGELIFDVEGPFVISTDRYNSRADSPWRRGVKPPTYYLDRHGFQIPATFKFSGELSPILMDDWASGSCKVLKVPAKPII